MPTYKIKLIKKTEIASKTTSFYFEKPANFNFKSGQYGKFTLIKPSKTDIKGDTRQFSFASTPFEKELMITIRMRNSAFKNELNSLPFGSLIELLGPLSMFSLPKNSNKPIVFLSGGIGVAAVRPMILEALENNFDNQILLFNSNRHKKDIPFFDEFELLQSRNKNFRYIPNLTKKDSLWTQETGYITSKSLLKYLDRPSNAIYYLVGPSRFMWGMYKILQELGVKESQINFDEFTGY